AYHVMNRTWPGNELFADAGDYEAFERVLAEALERFRSMRLCAYCLMPNHFHLVLWPRNDGELSRFMQWLTMTHAQRWHAHRRSVGRGRPYGDGPWTRSEEHTSELQSRGHLVCRLLLEKKKEIQLARSSQCRRRRDQF